MNHQARSLGGMKRLASRLVREYYAPRRKWSAVLVNSWLEARDQALQPFRVRAQTPIAVYDLRVCANTFDFAYFLYDADTHFRERGFDRFQVCIFDGKNSGSGVNAEYEAVIDVGKRRKRVFAMLVPMAEMYEGCSAVRVMRDPAELTAACQASALVFPRHADGRHLRDFSYADIYAKLAQRRPYSGFSAPQDALDAVARFKEHRGIERPSVTLTVRAYGYQPLRNTDLDVYFRFADHLRSTGFAPIFVPDADAPDQVDFRDFHAYPEACADLRLRVALYQDSYTNIFTSNGVHAVAAFNPRCSFIEAVLNQHYEASTGTKRWVSEGLCIGDQPFGGTDKQLVWDKETFANLSESFAIVRSHHAVQSGAARLIEAREFS